MHHLLHVASGKIVGFEIIAGHAGQSGLVCLDHGSDYHRCGHFTDTHQHELQQ